MRRSKGCTFDFICMHWYGAYDAADSFQSQVQNFYNTFKGYSPNVWVTEWVLYLRRHGLLDDVAHMLRVGNDFIKWRQ